MHILKIIFFGLVILLTSCIYCSTVSRLSINNESQKDVYVILKADSIGKMSAFNYFLKGSIVTQSKVDTIKNIGIFVIPSRGYLLLYDGPGDEPAALISYLKIISSTQIVELKNQQDIVSSCDKTGINYALIIK